MYAIMETLYTSSRVKVINKKKYGKILLEENLETLNIHISTLENNNN